MVFSTPQLSTSLEQLDAIGRRDRERHVAGHPAKVSAREAPARKLTSHFLDVTGAGYLPVP
ncbi:Hypothetical protein A7982_04034 [Minicystis rosea]|nr:Hypothetical protein A7982_04034 [Minicystis rosea]